MAFSVADALTMAILDPMDIASGPGIPVGQVVFLSLGIQTPAIPVCPHSTWEGSKPGTGHDTSQDPGTKDEDVALHDLSGAKGKEISAPIRASSSSSPNDAVAGAAPAPVPDDSRVYPELLCRVAQNKGLQAEEVVEEADSMVDILALEGPSRVSLLLVKTIWETTKILCRLWPLYFLQRKG